MLLEESLEKKSGKCKEMKQFGKIDDQSQLQGKRKHPIKFDLVVFSNYVYILFPRVDFYTRNVNKDDLKARSEIRR